MTEGSLTRQKEVEAYLKSIDYFDDEEEDPDEYVQFDLAMEQQGGANGAGCDRSAA